MEHTCGPTVCDLLVLLSASIVVLLVLWPPDYERSDQRQAELDQMAYYVKLYEDMRTPKQVGAASCSSVITQLLHSLCLCMHLQLHVMHACGQLEQINAAYHHHLIYEVVGGGMAAACHAAQTWYSRLFSAHGQDQAKKAQ